MSLLVVVEGDTDLPVVRHLAEDAGFEIRAEIDCGGKSRLDAELPGYNAAAKGSPWFVLRDLDEDAACAVELLRSFDLVVSDWMCLRIAVRELEAWLLADIEGLAQFMRVSQHLFPENPDLEADPTRTLVSLARRSRSREVQRWMVPKAGSSVQVGPAYEAKIIEFGVRHWNLERACKRSQSLLKARTALRELASRWRLQLTGSRLRRKRP